MATRLFHTLPAFYIILIFFGAFGLLTAALYGLIVCAQKGYAIDNKLTKVDKFKTFFIYFGIIIIAWLPYFIIFFPGILSSDSVDQWGQAIGAAGLNNAHPLFHTMVVRLSSMVSGNNTPWAFSLLQTGTLASSMAFVCTWLRLKGFKRYLVWVVLAFFALHPINGMYSITMWKDVMFACAVMLFTLSIAELVITRGDSLKSKPYFWLLVVSTLGVAHLRNNGTLVAFVTLLLIVLLVSKYRKRAACIVAILVITIIIKSLVMSGLSIPGSPIRESLAMPIQQISRTVVEGGKMSASDSRLISRVLPIEDIKASYQENTVDPIKFNPNFKSQVISDNKMAYLQLWLRLLPQNFRIYVRAFAEESRSYWDPLAYNWAIVYNIEENRFGLSQNQQLISQRKTLSKYVENVQAMGPVRLLWSGAVYSYVMSIMLLIIIFFGKQKRWLFVLPFLPFLLNWMTLFMATPSATSARYIYCSFLAFPVVAFLFFKQMKSDQNKQNQTN